MAQGGGAPDVGEAVFGKELFSNGRLDFSPSGKEEFADDYILGAGDELMVDVYGASQMSYLLVVQANGSVMIPDVGPVQVKGKMLGTARKELVNRLADIYSGVRKNKADTHIRISLTQPRMIVVNLVGEVELPGTYRIPGGASLFYLLHKGKGPNSRGSFRNLSVYRNGVLYRTVDVYGYLLKGETDQNLQLCDQDLVIVETAGKKVWAGGAFKRPGWYELLKEEKAGDLLRYAGGLSSKAYGERLLLVRKENTRRVVRDLVPEMLDTLALKNGDRLMVEGISSLLEGEVMISGAVYRPGSYQWSEGMTLDQLLEKAEGVKEEAFTDRLLIYRKKEDGSLKQIACSLQEVASGNRNILLEEGDYIQVKMKQSLEEKKYVEVWGEVLHPGRFAWTDSLSLEDLIWKAGGLTEMASNRKVEVMRRLSEEEMEEMASVVAHSYEFDVERGLEMDAETAEFRIEPFDQVFVRRAPGARPMQTVYLRGEILHPGAYTLRCKGELVSDVLVRTGGVTPEAFVKGATLRRLGEQLGLDGVHARKQVAIDLYDALERPGGENDFVLHPGDELLVPSLKQTVKVSGAVQNPVNLVYRDGLTLKDCIAESGGYSFKARKKHLYVIYANGERVTANGGWLGESPELHPGCEVVVPFKPERKKAKVWLRNSAGVSGMLLTLVAILKLSK